MCVTQTLCVLALTGISVTRNSVHESSFHVDGHQWDIWVWQVVNQRLPDPPRDGAYGHPYVPGAWLDSFSLGMRRKVPKARLSSSAWCCWRSACMRCFHGIWFSGGCRNQVWWISSRAPRSCSLSRHRPPAPYKTVMLPSTLGELFLSDGRREAGKWSYQFSPPDTTLCVCSGISLLERMTLLFLWRYSKGCTIYQKCFLIT